MEPQQNNNRPYAPGISSVEQSSPSLPPQSFPTQVGSVQKGTSHKIVITLFIILVCVVALGIFYKGAIGGIYNEAFGVDDNSKITTKTNTTASESSKGTYVHPVGLYTFQYPPQWHLYANYVLQPEFEDRLTPDEVLNEHGDLKIEVVINNEGYDLSPENTKDVIIEEVMVDGYKGYKYSPKSSTSSSLTFVTLDQEKKFSLVIVVNANPENPGDFMNGVEQVLSTIKINKDKIVAYEQAEKLRWDIGMKLYEDFEKPYTNSEDYFKKDTLSIDKESYAALQAKVDAMNEKNGTSIVFRGLIESNKRAFPFPEGSEYSSYDKNFILKFGDTKLNMYFCASSKTISIWEIAPESFEQDTNCSDQELNKPRQF